MKEIEVLGVRVKECSLRESLKLTDGYLRNGALNTVIYVSSKLLVDAGSNEEQKQRIADADLTIFGDSSVLKNLEDAPAHRIEEIEHDVYLKEFLKKVVRMHRSVMLLSDTVEHMESLKNEILNYQENVPIIAEHVMSEQGEDQEALLNKMNDIAPSVIFSRLDCRIQAKMMQETRKFLNADVWIGLLDSPAGKKGGVSRFHRLTRAFYRWLFLHDLKKEKSKTENKED